MTHKKTHIKSKGVVSVKHDINETDISFSEKLPTYTDNTAEVGLLASINDELDYNIPNIGYNEKEGSELTYEYDDIIKNLGNKMLEINEELDPNAIEVKEEVNEEEIINENAETKKPISKKKSIVKKAKAAVKINENKKHVETKIDKWKKIRDRKKSETRKRKPLIESKKSVIPINNINSLIEDISENDRQNQKELIEFIGEKMDNISDTIKNRPDSYKFDVKRDNQGYISTVLVKPNK